MKSLKKVLALALALTMVLGTMNFAFAAEVQNTAKADTLNTLGLFKGTDAGYELDKEFTRAQGATMVLRLYGLEDEALASTVANPFADVTGWAAPYVAYAYEKGISKGTSATTYSPNAVMTGEQYVTLVLRALGYADAEPHTAAGLAVEAGVLTVSEAVELSQGDFLRDDMINVSYKALAATVKGTEETLLTKLVENGVVSEEAATVSYADAYVTPSIALDDLDTDVDEVEYVVSGTATRLDAVTVNDEEVAVVDGKFEATVTLTDGENDITVSGEGAEDVTLTVTYTDDDAPVVVDKYPLGLKQVMVIFNEEVDEDLAEDEDNYTDEDFSAAELQDDNKSVVLTLTSAKAQNKEISFDINDIEDVNGNEMDKTEIEVKMVDREVPEVEKVEVVGNKLIKVTFTELVTSDKNDYSVVDEDGDDVVKVKDVTVDGRTAEVELRKEVDAGDYTLEVSGVEDYAGFVMFDESFDITVVEDEDAPEADLVSATDTEVVVTFSEDIKTDATDIDIEWKSGSKEGDFDTSLTDEDDGEYTFKVKATGNNDIPLSGAKVYIWNVEDYSGNKVDEDDAIVIDLDRDDISLDTERPEIEKVEQDGKNKVILTFTEDLTDFDGLAKDEEDINVYDEDGDEIDETVKFVQDTDDANKVNVTIVKTSDLTGTYTFEVEGFRDTSSQENEMIPDTFEFTFDDDDISTDISDFKVTFDTTPVTAQVIYITFPERMSEDTTEDPDNYKVLFGSPAKWRTVDSDADLELLDDEKTLKIEFEDWFADFEVSDLSAIDQLQIVYMEDEAGNTENTTVWITNGGSSTTGAVSLTEPVIESVKFAAKDKAVLTLAEDNIDPDTLDEDDFYFQKGSTKYYADSVSYDSDDKEITVMMDDEFTTDPTTSGSAIELRLIAASDRSSQNIFGEAITTTSGAIAYTEEIKPEVSVVEAVYFEEDGDSYFGKAGLFTILEVSEAATFQGISVPSGVTNITTTTPGALSVATTDDVDSQNKLFAKRFTVTKDSDELDVASVFVYEGNDGAATPAAYNVSGKLYVVVYVAASDVEDGWNGDDINVAFEEIDVPAYTVADGSDNVLGDFDEEAEIVVVK